MNSKKRGHIRSEYADGGELLNAYKVFLILGNEIINGLNYYDEIKVKVIEDRPEIYNISPRFWNDMSNNSFHRALNCLILLYDRNEKSLTLESFLKSLENELKTKLSTSANIQTTLSDVQKHLTDLKNDPLKSIIDNLIKLRVKKYFHLDFYNVIGKLHENSEIDPTVTILTFSDIDLMKEKAMEIITSLASVLKVNPGDFLMLRRDYENLLSNLLILFSEEKLKNRIEKVKIQGDIKLARKLARKLAMGKCIF